MTPCAQCDSVDSAIVGAKSRLCRQKGCGLHTWQHLRVQLTQTFERATDAHTLEAGTDAGDLAVAELFHDLHHLLQAQRRRKSSAPASPWHGHAVRCAVRRRLF